MTMLLSVIVLLSESQDYDKPPHTYFHVLCLIGHDILPALRFYWELNETTDCSSAIADWI